MRNVGHIFSAELLMLSTDAPGEDVRTEGLLLIATPTGKHWHVMPCKDYDNTEHLHAMALHDIGTMGLEELTVIACATQAEYVITRDDDTPNLEQDADQ